MVLMVYECGAIRGDGKWSWERFSDEIVTVRRERAQHKAACMRTKMTRA
jgi:hypothetical protein